MKNFLQSKTIWVNLLAVISFAIQSFTGHNIFPVEAQATALGAINLGLRFITKDAISIK